MPSSIVVMLPTLASNFHPMGEHSFRQAGIYRMVEPLHLRLVRNDA